MSTGAITLYRSDMRIGRDGSAQLLRAEWTKFKTVRRCGIGLMVAAPAAVPSGLVAAARSHASCSSQACHLTVPVGPSTVSLALPASSW